MLLQGKTPRGWALAGLIGVASLSLLAFTPPSARAQSSDEQEVAQSKAKKMPDVLEAEREDLLKVQKELERLREELRQETERLRLQEEQKKRPINPLEQRLLQIERQLEALAKELRDIRSSLKSAPKSVQKPWVAPVQPHPRVVEQTWVAPMYVMPVWYAPPVQYYYYYPPFFSPLSPLTPFNAHR